MRRMDEAKKITQIRMDPALRQRIDKYRKLIQKKSPVGVEISFSEAARSLIIQSLDRARV